ncbi:hypothetical protein [Bradyrhizobium sp. sGM-13]|uniref:hypothetical protein n=1 Tax=Bradyrhizobium sp. sGM-13 TaxID=2831781 RepID=UPI0035C7CEF8
MGGRLRPGERLSPTRELAAALTVARSTVTIAYEALSRKDSRHPVRAPGRSSAISLRRNVRRRKQGGRQSAQFGCVEFGKR